MTKRTIKIIKRETAETSLNAPTPDQILMQQQKDEIEDERDMKKAVKNWISERRENSRAEEVYSNRQLFEWDTDEPQKNAG